MTLKKRVSRPFCNSINTRKNGKRGSIQRYKCSECKKRFRSKRRNKKQQERLWNEYSRGKQTLVELGEKYTRSHVWVRKQLDAYEVVNTMGDTTPQLTVIVPDTTFWRRHYGVVVFRSWTLKRNIWWNEAPSEKNIHYYYGKKILEERGWIFTSAVVDGRRGMTSIQRKHTLQEQNIGTIHIKMC